MQNIQDNAAFKYVTITNTRNLSDNEKKITKILKPHNIKITNSF